jgi:hypothetical protein
MMSVNGLGHFLENIVALMERMVVALERIADALEPESDETPVDTGK